MHMQASLKPVVDRLERMYVRNSYYYEFMECTSASPVLLG